MVRNGAWIIEAITALAKSNNVMITKVVDISKLNCRTCLATRLRTFCSKIELSSCDMTANGQSDNRDATTTSSKNGISKNDGNCVQGEEDKLVNTLEDTKGPLPPAPTNCCMSGCHNCVWIDYADELIKYYNDGSAKDKVLAEIDKIEDPSMKAFLKIELS